MLNLLIAVALASVSITYPVSELGGCRSAADCAAYCHWEINHAKCASYGQERGFLGGEVLAAQVIYPIAELGNCTSKEGCKVYCDAEETRVACTEFARTNGLVAAEESGGASPAATFPVAELGGCASVAECRAYCSREENRGACAEYARKIGVGQRGTSGEEAQERGAALGISFPIAELGNCAGPDECEEYCARRENMEVCDSFAKAHGLVVEVDGPGGCTSHEECEAFCDTPENRQICMAWAEEHGMEDEGRAGPGGCGTPEECEMYCREHPDDKECQEGMREMEEYCKNNPDDEECRQMMEDGGPRDGGPGGSGGCETPEECEKYCEEHPNDEECRRGDEEYCREHPEECQGKDEGGYWEGGPPTGEEEEGGRSFPEGGPDGEYGNDFEGPEYDEGASEEELEERYRYCEEHPEECQ